MLRYGTEYCCRPCMREDHFQIDDRDHDLDIEITDDESTPVVVTSATHTAPGGYPVTQIPATTYQPHAYGTAYPAHTTGNVSVQMPMPIHMPGAQQPMAGMPPHVAAYPPMPQPGVGAANMNPPSYDMAMANPGPSVMSGGYEKQMPYNPNYAQ
ncbi:uncharacterized protein LOC135431903 isoform X4 [Drosophila montana]|uniref:uncharacterized protein LOC135431903 isoform X4 n=1 Tax=Drosophila montana TaxID=40370 RepID=UPI00313E03D3